MGVRVRNEPRAPDSSFTQGLPQVAITYASYLPYLCLAAKISHPDTNPATNAAPLRKVPPLQPVILQQLAPILSCRIRGRPRMKGGSRKGGDRVQPWFRLAFLHRWALTFVNDVNLQR